MTQSPDRATHSDNNNRTVKIGWVGAGFIGQVAHLSNYMEIPDADVVALAELRPKLGAMVCERYSIRRYYANHKEILEDPEIEAVVAVVRRHHTAPIALDILKSGRHLFTEKPMAQTLQQADQLASLAQDRDLCYAVGFMRRHDQGVQIARRMLAEFRNTNELGSILFARFYLSAGGDYCNIDGHIDSDEPKPTQPILPIAPDWVPERLHLEYEHFLNVCSHDLNLIRFLFGQRPTVKHVEYRRNSGNVIVMDFGEFTGVFEWTDTNQNRWEEGVDIYFERGRVHLSLPPAFLRNQPARVEVYKDNGKKPGQLFSPTPDWTWSFRRQDEAFVKDVKLGQQPIASGLDSVEDMRFLEDIWHHIC